MALIKPHQALDAYISLATITALKIICSELSHKPCARRTRSAYNVRANVVITFWTCSDTDKPFVRVTPRTFSNCTRCSSGIMTDWWISHKFGTRSTTHARSKGQRSRLQRNTETAKNWLNIDNSAVCQILSNRAIYGGIIAILIFVLMIFICPIAIAYSKGQIIQEAHHEMRQRRANM